MVSRLHVAVVDGDDNGDGDNGASLNSSGTRTIEVLAGPDVMVV